MGSLVGFSGKILVLLLILFIQTPLKAADCVVMLHGLARTSSSLNKMASALERADYRVANLGYPSRSGTIETLAAPAVEAGVAACGENDRISFVTHSMGGILLRYYLEHHTVTNLHRVVMMAPPNQGSKVVDAFRDVPGYKLLNGPAGLQLGTDGDSVPLRLGPVDYDLGIIAGNRSINWILSQFLENPDDGKVSVRNTRVEGMCGFIEMPVSHPMMMRNKQVIAQVLAYLADGEFQGEKAENHLCDRD